MTTPDQGLSLPVDANPADNPVAFNNFVAGVEPRLVRLYTDTADRTAKQLVVAENELSGLATENRVEVYNGTTNVSLHTRALYTAARMTANQVLTASSTALQNVTELVSPLTGAAGATYRFRAFLFYDATTTADIKFAFVTPAAATFVWGLNALSTGGTNPAYNTQSGSGSSIPAGASGLGTGLYAILDGTIALGASTGDLQLQAAQNVADASVTTMYTGSCLDVWRVA